MRALSLSVENDAGRLAFLGAKAINFVQSDLNIQEDIAAEHSKCTWLPALLSITHFLRLKIQAIPSIHGSADIFLRDD
jgi:hypothetical protein